MRTTNRRSVRVAVAAAVAGAAIVAAACTPAPPEPATGISANESPNAADAAYQADGPFKVGVTTLSFADRQLEVWYPADETGTAGAPRDVYNFLDFVPQSFTDFVIVADPTIPAKVNFPDLAYPDVYAAVTPSYRDVPAATAGPFPLVLFSHGAAGYRSQSSFLTAHLASWGFVVASPDYFERGITNALGQAPANPRPDTQVADEAIQFLRSRSATAGNLLSGTVDPASVFPIGHSAGGFQSQRMLTRPDVPAIVSLAGGLNPVSLLNMTAPALPADKSVLWFGGRNDGIARIDTLRTGFEYTAGPRKLIELNGGGHNNGFTDICAVGGGGVAGLARALNLPIPDSLLSLGDDGCVVPAFRPSVDVWPEVKHFVTAELRFRSGLDIQPVGLGDQVLPSFDDILVYRHNP
jgi:dienelactone hydrolase